MRDKNIVRDDADRQRRLDWLRRTVEVAAADLQGAVQRLERQLANP
jgi:hypothetical protein